MALTLETYWPLLLLAVVPALWLGLRSSAVDLGRKQLWLLAALRSAIVVLLALALAQPVVRTSSTEVSVVYLLDVSRSVAPAAIQDAIQWIQSSNDAGKPSHARFLAFGGNTLSFENADALAKVQVADRSRPDGAVDRSATDLTGALEAAARNLAANHLKRIVLLSDGNDHSGPLSGVLARLRYEHIHVYTRPLAARSNRDAWVEGLELPEIVTAEEQFPVEVQIYSQAAMNAEVEISAGGKNLGRQKTFLTEGLNRIAFETRVPDQRGTLAVEARVIPADDAFNENNAYSAPLVVEGKPRILYVEGRAASAKYLDKALTSEGLRVDVMEPAAAPSTPTALDRYDAVILSDVEGKLLSPAQMQALATYVRDLGGGLIVAGGENVYGEGGYSQTPIEKALPATFDVTRKKPPTVAMIVVLDNSNSMRGQKMELAKAAAKAPLELLRDVDHYGLTTFATGPVTWVVPLTGANNRAGITQTISTVDVSQQIGTDAFFSMQSAFESMNKVTDEIKTVLFLTDGQMTVQRDYRTLTKQMREAGIRVTTVAIGVGADRELLQDIAMLGKGRAYYLEAVNNVPQIFMRETELTMDKALHEERFNVLVKRNIDAFKGIDLPNAPGLLGYLVTKPKPTADVLLAESIGGDPVLMRWQHGLGKAVLFASDLKDRWAVNWVSWSGYGKFWAQLVRETMRRDNPDVAFQVQREGSQAVLSLDATGKDGRFRNGLSVESRMIGAAAAGGADSEVSAINLRQSGPGVYEARVAADPEGSYVFRAVVAGGPGPSRALTYSYPEEYRFYPTDTEKLQSISQETGGGFDPKGPEIFDPKDENVPIPHPLWPGFAVLALVLFGADLLLRRLRLFEA